MTKRVPLPRVIQRSAERRRVDVLLDMVGHEVAALPELEMAALQPVLAAAERELTRDLRAWLAKADGRERFTTQQYRRALVQIRTALEKVEALGPHVEHSLVRGGRRAGLMANENLKRAFARHSKVFEGTVAPVPFYEAALLAHGDRMLYPRFHSSAQRYAGEAGQAIRRQLAVGLVRGETFHELTNRLMRLAPVVHGRLETTEARAARGLFNGARWRAERLVRTELIHAYSVHADLGIRAAAETLPGLGRQWSAAADRRTCTTCAELDGATSAVGGEFPGGYDLPPAHPNCRCSVVAWHPSWE